MKKLFLFAFAFFFFLTNAQTEVKKEYYQSGKIKKEIIYKNDNKNWVEKNYFENGNLDWEQTVVNNKRNGVYKEYFENGILKKEIPYVNDLVSGYIKKYYDNGSIEFEILYANGDKIGYQKDYPKDGIAPKAIVNTDSNGKLQFETSYLQPNTIIDQKDTSTFDNPDEIHRQIGYHEYHKLITWAQQLIHGWGETKEINYDKAIAICTEAIRIFPNLSDAYISRGQTNSKAKNTIAAQNDFDKAKTLSPYGSGYIDRCIAAIEGRDYIDPKIQQEADIQRAIAAEQEKIKNTTQTQVITSHKCSSCKGSGTEEYVYNAFQKPLKRACTSCNGKGIIYD